jgi:putative flippase GtrA
LARGIVLGQFARFAAVGVVGFGIDTLTLYSVVAAFSFSLYAARLLSYLAAASVTWFLNRIWTFRHSAGKAVHREWLSFLSANSIGGAINYGVYALLIHEVRMAQELPVIAVAAGSVSGLAINFGLSRYIVFRHRNSGVE